MSDKTDPTGVLPVPRHVVAGGPEAAFLVVIAGPHMGDRYRIEAGQTLTIGRQKGLEIVLADDGVSRKHACIFLEGKVALVEDLGSRNGTFVEGVRVNQRALSSGDRIQVGARSVLKFVMTDSLEQQYERHLIEAALRDPLTRLYNRRHFDERLEVEFSSARRHRRCLGLLIIDVDRFKRINDMHGHLAGDKALKLVGRVLARTVRKEDLVARYGGEEFVILAPETGMSGAELLAERIRKEVETSHVQWETETLKVTVSVGVTVADGTVGLDPIVTAKDVLKRADRALYQAKEKGRNCAVSLPMEEQLAKKG